MIQGVFNITPTPTVLQLMVYLTYLVVVLALFLRPTRASRASGPPPRCRTVGTPNHTPERSTT